jgi:hypothetical protein
MLEATVAAIHSIIQSDLGSGLSTFLFSSQRRGSGMFISDPNFLHPGSRVKKIPYPGSASKNFSILTQKIVSKLSEYDPGCSSRIRILILYPSRIPDPGVKKTPDPGSGSAALTALVLFRVR